MESVALGVATPGEHIPGFEYRVTPARDGLLAPGWNGWAGGDRAQAETLAEAVVFAPLSVACSHGNRGGRNGRLRHRKPLDHARRNLECHHHGSPRIRQQPGPGPERDHHAISEPYTAGRSRCRVSLRL